MDDDTTADGDGSTRPGVFIINDSGHRNKLAVELEIAHPGSHNDLRLTGELEGITFTAEIPACESKKNVRVEAFCQDRPASFKRIRGNMKWRLEYRESKANITMELEETRLEIFWVYGYPGKMYKKGVWVEVLRLLDVECLGLEEKKDIIRRIVNYCHSGAGLRYDNFLSMSFFGLTGTGGAFQLEAFLENAHPFCNCYDQTAALQTLLGALGIHVQWVYMDSFGCIHEVNLAGRGRCNNTNFFWKFDSGVASESLPELLPRYHDGRMGFGNHTFCLWKPESDGVILDTSIGPYMADEIKKNFTTGYKQVYLDAAVDKAGDLYLPVGDRQRPGGLTDMDASCPGVTDVHGVTGLPMDEAFKLTAGQEKGVVHRWRSPFDLEAVPRGKNSWLRTFENLRVGPGIAVKEWCLIGVNRFLQLEISVANNQELARDMLRLFPLSSSRPRLFFEPKPRDRANGQEHLFSRMGYFQVDIWRVCNIFFKVVNFNSSIAVETLLDQTREQICRHVKENLEEYLPAIRSVVLSKPGTPPGAPFPGKIEVGGEIVMRIEVEANEPAGQDALMLEFFLNGESLRLVKETAAVNHAAAGKTKTFELTFVGKSPGAATVKLVAADSGTLLCSRPWEAAVNVVSAAAARR
jgi:hypothetical protein